MRGFFDSDLQDQSELFRTAEPFAALVDKEALRAIHGRSHIGDEETRSFTITIPESYVAVLDMMAGIFDTSRNRLVPKLVCSAIDQASESLLNVEEIDLAETRHFSGLYAEGLAQIKKEMTHA